MLPGKGTRDGFRKKSLGEQRVGETVLEGEKVYMAVSTCGARCYITSTHKVRKTREKSRSFKQGKKKT